MKIGIIGDIHKGAGLSMGYVDPTTQLNTRLLDFIDTFNSIIDEFIKRDVKNIVILGDCYNSRHPTSDQINAFSRCLRRAIDSGVVKIIIVAGNHDQERQISTTTLDIYNELKIPEILVYTDFGVYTFNKSTHLILMPYRDRKVLGANNNAEAVKIIDEKINGLSTNLNGHKIVFGHFMIEKTINSLDPELFSVNEIMLPLDMFNNYSAAFFGHIHRPEIIKKNPLVVYVGSMDKVSFAEREHKKSSIILDTDDIDDIEVVETKTRNLFEISLDYSDTLYKKEINTKILQDIDKFDQENNIKDAIVKVMIRVKENDSYFVGQPKIKDYVVNKGIKFCSGVYMSTTSSRQLRDNVVNETMSSTNAMNNFIKNLDEPEEIKKRLIKEAEKIIKETEGK